MRSASCKRALMVDTFLRVLRATYVATPGSA